ncbi:MAG: hypothetical protein ACO1TE_10540 [Prosthecobacter sp.]
MKLVSPLLAAGLLASLLASCASSTMDSVPTVEELNKYASVVRARYQAEYAELERKRASGALSKESYEFHKRQLDSEVDEAVNNAAWNKHFLAESERKADGVPTPDQPVALNPGGVAGDSFYRPSNQNFGQVTGQSGSAGLGSMRGAQEQFGQGQTIRNDAMSAGGSYLSQPPPGSVYDDEDQRRR